MLDFLDEPNRKLWNERSDWIEKLIDDRSRNGEYDVSEQAGALAIDLQIAYCAGAWVAVIILSIAIIDAHLREIEVPEFQGNTEKLLKETGLTNELDWLRKRRNKLIHLNIDNPAITVDDQWEKRELLEVEARKAIELVFDVLFSSHWV
ncbi:hypothetical protein R84B8_01290 [Treponema sp. R8-4-B8]